MNKELRKVIIAGNWKMNKTRAEAKVLIEELKPVSANADCEVVNFYKLETAVTYSWDNMGRCAELPF